jgi:type II secretory pathway pseudopilin PulG
MNKLRKRRGVTLIETVACVVIVSTMAVSIIGVMQGSVRIATASRTAVGAPAEARQTLRLLADRFRALHETEGIVAIHAQSLNGGTHAYKFDARKSSSGNGTDLFLVDDSGTETLCVSSSLSDFRMAPIFLGTTLIGVELQLELQKTSADAATLRPNDRQAKMVNQVCFPPFLKAGP